MERCHIFFADKISHPLFALMTKKNDFRIENHSHRMSIAVTATHSARARDCVRYLYCYILLKKNDQ